MNRINKQGFTLIELIVVIVLLGILAVIALPRFINLQDDGRAAMVSGTGGAFEEAIEMAHMKWQAGGHGGSVDNLDLYGNGDNLMDMNASGWPAQSWPPFEANPQLNNTADCISVWQAVLDENSPTVATNTTEDFQVTYSANTCTFMLVAQPAFSIYYDSRDGSVIIDTTP